jgi:hypothetical protein
VFDASPDGAAWWRMKHLSYGKPTPAQQAELDQLRRRYPGMPLESHDGGSYEWSRFMKEKLREHVANGLIEPREPVDHNWCNEDTRYNDEKALWQRVERYRTSEINVRVEGAENPAAGISEKSSRTESAQSSTSEPSKAESRAQSPAESGLNRFRRNLALKKGFLELNKSSTAPIGLLKSWDDTPPSSCCGGTEATR